MEMRVNSVWKMKAKRISESELDLSARQQHWIFQLLLILGYKSWKPLTVGLNFGVLNRSKEFKLHTGILEQIKPLQLIGQAAEFRFESKIEHLLIILQLLQKGIAGDNPQAQLGPSWAGGTARTRSVLVCSSRCGP